MAACYHGSFISWGIWCGARSFLALRGTRADVSMIPPETVSTTIVSWRGPHTQWSRATFPPLRLCSSLQGTPRRRCRRPGGRDSRRHEGPARIGRGRSGAQGPGGGIPGAPAGRGRLPDVRAKGPPRPWSLAGRPGHRVDRPVAKRKAVPVPLAAPDPPGGGSPAAPARDPLAPRLGQTRDPAGHTDRREEEGPRGGPTWRTCSSSPGIRQHRPFSPPGVRGR